MSTVKLGYSSNSNISFKGWVDTEIEQAEWDDMSEEERDEAIQQAMNELVEMYVIEKDKDPDEAIEEY